MIRFKQTLALLLMPVAAFVPWPVLRWLQPTRREQGKELT